MTRYRTQTLTRTVPHTVGGDTRLVTVTDKVQVPIVPRDWDRLVKSGVSLVAVVVIIASVIWSTTSIGALLARTVPSPVAYTAAVIFDATWITALAVEWLNRYNTAKARLPRRVGHLALALAMGAVCVHGWLAGSLWAGIVGGVISGLAKVVWTLVLHHHAQRLDDRTQQWVDQRSAEAGARLAMVAVGRLLADAEDTVSGADVPVITTVEDHDQSDRRAVRAALQTMPDASAGDIVEQLARVGITVDEDTVRSVREGGDAADAHHDALHVNAASEIAKSEAIRDAASVLGGDARAAQIVDLVRERHHLEVEPNYVRAVLSREAKRNGGDL